MDAPWAVLVKKKKLCEEVLYRFDSCMINSYSLVSLGVCSLTLSTIMYLVETFIFHSVVFDFHIAFPCVLNGNYGTIYRQNNIAASKIKALIDFN